MLQDHSAQYETIVVERRAEQLWVTLNRPDARNAMNAKMVVELGKVAKRVREDRTLRAVVLRGAGDHFSAGGDLEEMRAQTSGDAATQQMQLTMANRTFGRLLQMIDQLPQAVVAVAHGAVMGGGVGLCCVADIVLADPGVKFRLPETSLGLPPAQIMPFVLSRVGPSNARRLAVLGGSVDAADALGIGLVHEVANSSENLSLILAETLGRIRRCSPAAVAATKEVLRIATEKPLGEALDRGAELFAVAALSAEGQEGLRAFADKRFPQWATVRKHTLV